MLHSYPTRRDLIGDAGMDYIDLEGKKSISRKRSTYYVPGVMLGTWCPSLEAL